MITFREKEDFEISNNENSKEFGKKNINRWEITDEKDFISVKYKFTLKDKEKQMKLLNEIWKRNSKSYSYCSDGRVKLFD